MSAPVELKAMFCLRCQSPLAAQPEEVFWVCANCGQAMLLTQTDDLLTAPIHYAANLQPGVPGKPVWVAYGQPRLVRDTSSGNQTREMEQFWSTSRWFFIPAYELPLDQLVESGVRMLTTPPAVQEGTGAGSFLPVTVPPEDVLPLAEYIVLTVEANRKDTLESLGMTLQLSVPELWIFA